MKNELSKEEIDNLEIIDKKTEEYNSIQEISNADK